MRNEMQIRIFFFLIYRYSIMRMVIKKFDQKIFPLSIFSMKYIIHSMKITFITFNVYISYVCNLRNLKGRGSIICISKNNDQPNGLHEYEE